MKNRKAFIIVFLGLLTAFGPFVTDMYLPTLPAMAEYFVTTSSMVQLGLTFSMTGLAVGQLIFGPLSDRFGRRSPLIAAMVLFLVSTLWCIYSGDIMQFASARLLQGIAGAGGIVIARSTAADSCSGKDLAMMLAMIGAINGIAPVAAPVIGGLLAGAAGWQGIFWCLFALGIILLAGSLYFRETLHRQNRTAEIWSGMLKGVSVLARNRNYLCYILQFGFAQGVLFSNISSAPFIMQEHYGFSEMQFSIIFGVNAVAIVIFAALSVKFKDMQNALKTGSAGMFAVSVILCLAMCLGCGFWLYETLIVCLLAALGLTFTASNTLAMDAGREHAGTASALLGAAGFAFGGAVSPLAGMGNTMVSTGILFAVCSACALACAMLAVRKG